MAAKLSQRFLAGIILCLFAGNLFAFNPGEIRGFDEKVFEYYFDRADREADPSSWMREARQGIQLAIAGWETQALEFYADPDFRFEAGRDLIRWSEEELEKRYAQWLFKRFFGSTSGQTSKILDKALDTANRLYAYHTDDAGNIIYDETGAPQSVRPSEGRSVNEDKTLWNDLVARAGEQELRNYRQTVAACFPELLSYIDEENRSRFEEYFSESLTTNILSRQAEFEAIFAREERLFVARRTGDIWSLRKQSENQSAALITSQLIREVEASCAAGIASLEERIEAARAGTGDLALLGEEWLTAFQDQFDRGLKAWSDAEERFIIRRMEWERDSGERFLEGEEAWKTAFAELEKERLVWEEDARKLFAAGEQLFIDVSEQLNAAINEARDEFFKDASLRITGAAERAGALVEMYITCSSVLSEAAASVNFWLSRFVDGAPKNAMEDGTLGTWVQNILNRGWYFQGMMTSKPLTEEQKAAGRELVRWAGIYTQYREKSLESFSMLKEEFGLVLGTDRGALNTVLESSSEDFFLDEYQIELLRAKAIADYWEQRLAIAEAVSSYADDLTAGRMTEAESLQAWRDAKSQYDKAIAAYENFQEQLGAAGNALADVHAELREKAEELAAEEKKVDELAKRYGLQMSVFQSETAVSIYEKLEFHYEKLMGVSGIRLHDKSYYDTYLGAEIKLAEEYMLKDSWDLLETIALSDADPETKQLQLSLLGAVSSVEWYYAVSGKEETPEDRQALEAEGLLKRLKREAEWEAEADPTPGIAQKMLSVYRELASYAPGLQADAARFAWQSLSKVFAEFGISVSMGALPDLLSLANQLLAYGEENERSPGSVIASLFIRIDSETEILPMMLGEELSAWKEALIDYTAVAVLSGNISVPEDPEEIFANYKSLYTDICNRVEREEEVSAADVEEAAFCQNLLEFLVVYHTYKTSIETANNEKREHWLSYVSGIESEDEEYTPLSWEVCLLVDSMDSALEAGRRITAAFGLFLESGISERQMEFIASAGALLGGREIAWEDAYDEEELTNAMELFWTEAEKLQNDIDYENSIKQQIAELGYNHYVLFPPGIDTLQVLENITAETEQARLSHQLALEAYAQKADEYAQMGDAYEKLYGKAKELFNNLENARIEYEKQDAIQRWASTAYLNQSSVLSGDLRYYKEPAEELAYARERSERAQTALAALQDLYRNGETSRAFADSEYMALYEDYRESFSAMFLSLRAATEYNVTLQAMQTENQELYDAFSASAFEFFPNLYQLSSYYKNYTTAPSLKESSLLDFLCVTESGKLGISRDGTSFKLQQISKDDAAKLLNYFTPEKFAGDGTSQMSAFETALSAWVERMAEYDPGKADAQPSALSSIFKRYYPEYMEAYQTLGLALDYIIRNLVQSNPDIDALKGLYSQTNLGSDGYFKLHDDFLNDLVSSFHNSELWYAQNNAWNKLDDEQKADLEFLAVLVLAGGEDKWIKGLTNVSEYREMSWLYVEASRYKNTTYLGNIKITTYKRPYTFDHSGLDRVFDAAGGRRDTFYGYVNSGRAEFLTMISESAAAAEAYYESCDGLAALLTEKEEGVEWNEIESFLVSTESFGESELEALRLHWEKMLEHNMDANNDVVYTTIGSAISAIYFRNSDIRNNLEQQLELEYRDGENDRRANQDQYRITLDAYINGECTEAELRKAAELSYGPETASLRTHYYNLGMSMIYDLVSINTGHPVYVQQYQLLGDQLAALTERAYGSRFGAELAVREIEWDEQRKDLNTKLASWQEAAGLILERGRQDWKTGYESMEAAYRKWSRDFLDRYTEIDAAWNAAYFDSLENKESWINEAINAANDALNNNLLAIIGPDAEAGSRKLDGFMPSSFMDFGATEEASAILRGVLESAGIVNLHSAVGAAAGSASTVLSQARSGVSGLGLWNSGQAQAAARELAWTSTSELASGKMAILALEAREAVYETKKHLEEQVVQSNKNFDESMDDLFQINGGWTRSGNAYIKDIVVHSTAFKSAITEGAVVNAYKWFVMDYWDFSTDLSDANLQDRDYLELQYFIGLAQREIQEKRDVLFGTADQEGKFQEHIGEYSREKPKEGKYITVPTGFGRGKEETVWMDACYLDDIIISKGEYGRLISAFYDWEGRQAQGIALMSAAVWDKPLWDSRGSSFNAPSIRTTIDIANSIAAAVIGAVLAPFTAGGSFALALGINMTDDLIFNALDVKDGYKSWDEAGVELGKKSLISAAASAGGAAFNGIGTAATGVAGAAGTTTGFAGLTSTAVKMGTTALDTIATQTVMAAGQAFVVGTATSAINAITYSDGKFGWSSDIFGEGLKGAAISSVVAGAGSFTTGVMNLGLEGFYDKYYANGAKLSSLVGGLAGQGVNYAFGGDFTLNAFNLGFMNDKLAGSGLLELHFGRDGFSSNLGTGGVDVSAGTLVSALKGLEAWKVNFDIWTSDSVAAKEYIKEMRSLYSGSEKNRELYESLLAGQTTIAKNDEVAYTQTTHDPVGGKTITLGKDALDDGSRFGLSVILSHESYRNGIDDGFEGQRLETNEAVMGHISTALGLMGTYGAGSIGAAMAGEAKGFVKSYQIYASSDSDAEKKAQAEKEMMDILNSYDASADYWKLVNDKGKWKWAEDGSLDFNFDLSDPMVSEAVYKATGSNNSTIKAEDITIDLLFKLAKELGCVVTSNANNPAFNFVYGTIAFKDASLAAKDLMDSIDLQTTRDSLAANRKLSKAVLESEERKSELSKLMGLLRTTNQDQAIEFWLSQNSMTSMIQQNLNAFNEFLMDVQKSGLLMENPVIKTAGLIGGGTDAFPYLPLTGNVAITCLEGWRFNAEGKLGSGNKDFPKDDFARYFHTGTDLVSYTRNNVVASTDGSLQLGYNNTFGLRGFLTSDTGNMEFISSHLAKETVMDYLAAFGMSGTSLSTGTNGQYMLDGLQAGVTFGTMGNTGGSFGAHVDFIVKDLTGKMTNYVFDSIRAQNTYGLEVSSNWVTNYSGIRNAVIRLDGTTAPIPNGAIIEYMLERNKKYDYALESRSFKLWDPVSKKFLE